MRTWMLPGASVHTGALILVNQKFPFTGEARALVPVGGQKLESTAAQALERLMAELDGWSAITPVSGWRSHQEQRDLYDQSLRDNGKAFTEQFVALPGHSEHETGLAIDLGLTGPDIDFIRPDFPYTGLCGEFRARAAAYGFVERYPAGKEEITGIAHEPWHFRYVGAPHAEIMVEQGMTLEEYHDFLKEFSQTPLLRRGERGVCRIYYREASSSGVTRFSLDTGAPYDLSGDNEGGFILTLWEAD